MHKTKAKLRTSFVVTVSAATLSMCETTCKKQGVDSEDGKMSVSRGSDGSCQIYRHFSCPKGANCNPPPPEIVDCPPNLRDASADPPAVTRRPPGKEDWLRMRPSFYYSTATKAECGYVPERFCAPPGKEKEGCTPYREPIKVQCTIDVDAGKPHYASFIYKDGVDQCHKVPEADCVKTYRGGCEVPDGDVVPCTPDVK